MERGYTYADFIAIVEALRARVPGIAITTDLLVGFCGESEEDHAATLAVMPQLAFEHAFMFAYSEREGTRAAKKIPDDVPEAVKQRRLAEVVRAQEAISAAANARYVGRVERVLLHTPSKRSPDELLGRTDTFKAVIVPRGAHAPGDLVDVRIERATSATLFGSLVY
jgi:tRNA-2-methylthio-N6-dimethylallyladenosine synthase